MSNRITCSSCFKLSTYEAVRPTFCGFCGKPINGGFVTAAQKTDTSPNNIMITKNPNKKTGYQKKLEKSELGEDEYEDEEFEIPQIDKLDVIIQKPHKETLGSLISNPDNSSLGVRREEKLPEIPNN